MPSSPSTPTAHPPDGPVVVLTAAPALQERARRARSQLASLIVGGLLAACGGGADEASVDEAVSSSTANDLAADTVVEGSEAMAAIDTTVLAAEAVVATQAGATSGQSTHAAELATAAAPATGMAVASVPVTCPGGGSAVLSISGGTAASVLNGQFDSGETYAIDFSDCRFQTGGAAVTGAAELAVDGLEGTQARLALTLEAVTVQLARGNVVLDGDAVWQGSQASDGTSTTVSTDLSISSLSLTSTFGARTASFALRDVAVTRVGLWVDGVLASSSMSGSYTIASSRTNNSFEATVTTVGNAQYGADGVPTSGAWRVDFTTWSLQMSVSGETVTLGIDLGQDGSIDKTYTSTRASLSADAG